MSNQERNYLNEYEDKSAESGVLFHGTDKTQQKNDPSLRSREDTVNLLKECNAGCKSATNSIEQVELYIEDKNFWKLLKSYNDKHIKIGDETHKILNKYKEDEKDPAIMAKAFSRLSTNVKLMMNDDIKKIADLMIDGCVMGIKSVSGYINQYKDASDESKKLAFEIIKTEKNFMDELLIYL